MGFSKAAAVVAVLVFDASAHAAELFVSPSGNDANAGTLAAPFRTLTKASTVSRPGDKVSVRGGIYGKQLISAKGTASARIVFRAYPGEKAIMDGTGLSSTNIVVNLSDAEYVDFVGFEVRNAPFIGINVRNAKSVRVAGNEIHHCVRNAVYVGADTIRGTSDTIIENNVAYNNVLENQAHTWNGGWAGTLVITYSNGGIIRNNLVYNNDGEAIISNNADNVVITGNETYDNFSQGVYLDNARYTRVEGNLIYSTGNTRYYRDGYPGQGIAIANEIYDAVNPSSHNTIVNNIVIGTRWGFYYGAFQAGGGLKNTLVANNTFYGAAQEAILIESDTHASSVVENNIFHQAGGRGGSYAGGGVTFRNNNWYGASAGTAAGEGDVIGNPALARPGGFTAADYRLTSLSVALGKATDASNSVTADFFGTARTRPLDVGAHQLSAAPSDGQAPSVPSALRTVGGQGISVAWNAATDNVGVTGYNVLRNGVSIANVSTTGFSDTAAQKKTMYLYQVVAYDAAGNRSAASATLSAAWNSSASEADREAPRAPEALRVASVSTTTVTLNWEAATDNVEVKEYMVYQDGVEIGRTITTAWTVTSLSSGRMYTFTVAAADEAGNESPFSAAVTLTTAHKKRRAA